jgi:hypothetical protein
MKMKAHSMHVESSDRVERLTPPFIDKISFTVPVTEHAAQAHLVGRIEGYRRDRAIHAPPPRHKANYAHAVSIPLNSSATLLVQAAPTGQRKQGSAFARLELNPARAGIIGIREFQLIAADLFPCDYIRAARVSRVDVAIDIHGTKISELAIYSPRHQKSMVAFGRWGDIETMYIGAKRSGKQVVVYDKARQLREKQRVNVVEECTRFETRVKTYVSVRELAGLKNPFAGIEVFNCPTDFPELAPNYRQMFCDSVSLRGLQTVLRMLTRPMRRAIMTALAEHRCSYWEAEKLWSGWGAAVEALGFRSQ